MKLWYKLILAASVGFLSIPAQPQQAADPAVLSAIRVLSPKPGEKVTQSVLRVTYELATPISADSNPRFELRLDTRDPERIRDTEHTFTGLTPGPHTLSIQLIDANDRPVPGARAEIEFMVVQPKSRDEEGRKPYIADSARLVLLAGAGPPSRDELPAASSPLPLLSLIGFGVLLGGLAAGTRSR